MGIYTTDFLLNGIITGIENMGGKFVKIKEKDIYFLITIKSQIDDEGSLKLCRDILKNEFGLIMKIKKI